MLCTKIALRDISNALVNRTVYDIRSRKVHLQIVVKDLLFVQFLCCIYQFIVYLKNIIT